MAAAREALKDLGYDRLVLWVLEGNDRACRFYERHGWVVDGQRQLVTFDSEAIPAVRYVIESS